MKKLIILSLAVLSFAACNEAAKPAPEAKQPAPQAAPVAAPVKVNQIAANLPAAVQKDYTLPALKGEAYAFTKKINEKPVVIAFMAGFCGWCKKMLPNVDELAKKVPASKADVIIGFMDPTSTEIADLEPVKAAKNVKIYYNAGELMREQGVSGFPTIILFKDGKQVQAWRGYSPNHVDSILNTLNNL